MLFKGKRSAFFFEHKQPASSHLSTKGHMAYGAYNAMKKMIEVITRRFLKGT